MRINGITRHQCMESQLKAKPTDRGYFSSRFFNLSDLIVSSYCVDTSNDTGSLLHICY